MDDSAFEMLRDIARRLLIVEAKLGLPMSYIDQIMVQDILKRQEERRAAHEQETADKIAALHEAEAEAERVGHRGPLDAFTLRVRRGEFDRYPH
jgi:hypothetical protein